MDPSERSQSTVRKTRNNVTVKEKMNAVLRVLAGEDLEVVAESISVSSRRLGEWKETFVRGGEAELTANQSKPKSTHRKDSGRAKALTQWAILLVVLFVVVFMLVRMLDRQPPQ